MQLGVLLAGLPVVAVRGDLDVEVRGIAHDSRQVKPGDLFVCIPGYQHDGHQYISEAYRRGAVVAVTERQVEASCHVLVPDSRQALAHLASVFYGNPSARLRLIGITGTNGKTTTAHMLYHILQHAGRDTGLLGTICYRIGQEEERSHQTTPDALWLTQILARLAGRGARYAVMEVSSHGLALKRVAGCCFHAAVFTNITRDHFDFHRDFEDYLAAKCLLFRNLATPGPGQHAPYAVVNCDDPNWMRVASQTRARVITCGTSPGAWLRAEHVGRVAPNGFELVAPGLRLPISLAMPGKHNVDNALAAAAVALEEGVDPVHVAGALARVTVPGRWECVDRGQPFRVVVDFAHNPAALERMLQSAGGNGGRTLLVFGCEGGKDSGKRPLMGTIAGLWSHHAIITSDNCPREDPGEVARQVRAGLNGHVCAEIILDRRLAIGRALELARPGDTVVVAGKGHETHQYMGEQKWPFDDRVVIEELLEALGYHARPRRQAGAPELPCQDAGGR
ncbi:MAG: UDP-N-acetylmuramoyl-L-alanyl-D-glutamate--2,6-diaminopimelate ligase [Bacillota bacterium]